MIAEICARAGLDSVDVSRVHGVVRGFMTPSTDAPRAMLQTLMLTYGVEAIERDGKLIFAMRAVRPRATLRRADLLRGRDGDLVTIRALKASRRAACGWPIWKQAGILRR